jgi:hypothetical protein
VKGVVMFRLWRVFSFVLVLAFLLVQAAAAETATTKKKPEVKAPVSPPMVFAIVRSGVTGCEPNCPQWISAEGQIMPGSAGQFRKILKQAGKQRLPVVITSQGGDVEAALAMGNLIRERKLDVVVGWTLFTGCNPTVKTCKLPKEQKGVYAGLAMTSRAYCFSACPFILAAGQKRMLGTGAVLGVHEISTQPVTQRIRYNETYRIVNGKKKVLSRKVVSRKNIIGKVTTKLNKPFDRKLRNYLTTMGVSVTMLDLLHLAPPSSIHNLTFDEMKSTKLVTAFGNAGELVSNSLCKATSPADNCKIEKNFVVALVPPPTLSKEPPSVRPAYGSPITFFIVRSSLVGCEPTCPEWIYADGKITDGTLALFKKILTKTENKRLPIVIRSDGGDALAAMALGRLIRAKKLDVVVATTLFVGCPVANKDCRSAPDKNGRYPGALISNKDYCNSACTLILAAGQKRLVEYSTTVGVQKLMPENKPGSGKVVKASTAKKTEDEFQQSLGKYLDEMGVSRELLATMDQVPPLGLKNLTYAELATAKLMTEHVPIANLATNAMCKASPPADNCIKR